ncbi:zonular occludens toxin domain-containing protein [Luteibacter sp. PPL554]
MIYYISGQPGHGKTLYTISLALKFQEEGRTVYSFGIPGEKRELTGFLPIENPTDWQSLPDNSVIVLDECYTHFPKMPAGSKVPAHIEAMARHRHRGFDFLIISQKGDQIHDFVKGLIEEHRHVSRKFGGKTARIKIWDRFESSSAKAKDYITSKMWRYPKKLYGYYKSATTHTMKWKMPWYFYVLPILLAVVIFMFWKVTHIFSGDKDKAAEGVAAQAATAPAADLAKASKKSTGDSSSEDDELRHKDYIKWITPRVPGQPWTAPAYDHMQVQSQPDLYCIAAEDGDCLCHTEQGTRYPMDLKLCRIIVRDGVYNPFRRVVENSRDHDRASRAEDVPAVYHPVDIPQGIAPVPASKWKAGVGGSYVPPEQTAVSAIGS